MSESGEQPQTILVVLVGAAKAGKTTWARERFAASEIVPVDGLAAMTGGDAPDVPSRIAADGILDEILEARLGRGLMTVVDGPGLEAAQRTRWLEAASRNGMAAYAALFTTDPEECVSRNVAAGSPIPDTVVRRQAKRCLELEATLEAEGFVVQVIG